MSPAQKKMIQALQYKPRRANEVASAAGVTVDYARAKLAEMYEAGLIHISGWEKVGKQTVKVYSLGKGRDKEKPRPLSKVEIMQRYNKKWKSVIRRRNGKPATPWSALVCL